MLLSIVYCCRVEYTLIVRACPIPFASFKLLGQVVVLVLYSSWHGLSSAPSKGRTHEPINHRGLV